MPHQSDAFEELDVCDDVRESSHHRDGKNEFSNFQGTKQAETFGTSQFRVSKSRSHPESNHIRINPNGTKKTNTLQSERQPLFLGGL